ncbi:protein-disulfide reductase DsbD family protein [Planctomycetota bacterium]
MKKVFILLVFAALGLQAQTLPFLSPVTVDIERIQPGPDSAVEVRLALNVGEGIHVYATAEQFFEIKEEVSQGLGALETELPPTKPFLFDTRIIPVFEGSRVIIKLRKPYAGRSGEPWVFKGHLQYQACSDTTCFPAATKTFEFSGTIPEGVSSAPAAEVVPPAAEKGEAPFYKRGLFLGILFSFLAGLGLGLTPCVYPMVGITVAIIGSGSSSRKHTMFLTAVYVLGLSLVYGLIGVIIASAGDKAHAASQFLRSAWVLVPIGIIFVGLGLSMFDLFTLQTPSSLAGRIQKAGGKLRGSVWGTFLMGALSSFVVGPCISGPLLGLIFFVIQTGEKLRGFAYFFALAWGMGIILFMAGAFSGALPKAGAWMQRVKHVLGIVLIWAAFYFTRGLIGETVYWTASIVAVALGLNALGLFGIPSGQGARKALPAAIAGILLFGGFVYFVSSHTEAPVKPAMETVDLEDLLAKAERPVVLDFTAPWCKICEVIEKKVLLRPDMQPQLAKFELVKVDFDNNEALRARFNIIGPPAYIFVDRNGNQIGETTVTAENLEERLRTFDFALFYKPPGESK